MNNNIVQDAWEEYPGDDTDHSHKIAFFAGASAIVDKLFKRQVETEQDIINMCADLDSIATELNAFWLKTNNASTQSED